MHDHSVHCHHASCNHPSHGEKSRLLTVALLWIAAFAAGELAVGLWSHSLALMAEAGHMVSDSCSLALALGATWIARLATRDRPAQGNQRVEVAAALINSLSLLSIAIWVGWEAIARLQAPPTEILSLPMLITATVGLAVNSLNASLLHDHSHHDLNLKGAFLHMLADAFSSVGVILAAIAVWAWHWLWADGVISLLVSGVILVGAVPLFWQSLTLLLQPEPTPKSADIPLSDSLDRLIASAPVLGAGPRSSD